MVEILITVLCLGPLTIVIWFIFEKRKQTAYRKSMQHMWEGELEQWRHELREFKYFPPDDAGALREADYREFEKDIRELKELELQTIKKHIRELERILEQPLPAINFWNFYRNIVFKWVPTTHEAVLALIFGTFFIILGILMLMPGIGADITSFIDLDWQWEKSIAPFVLMTFGIFLLAMGLVRFFRPGKQKASRQGEAGKKNQN